MWVQSLDWEDPLERHVNQLQLFLPGEPHGQRSLAGYSPWSCKESDTTEETYHTKNVARESGECK